MDIKKILSEISKYGFCTIPDFLTHSECDQGVLEINLALEKHKSKLWTGALQADKRLFGIERESTIAKKFLEDSNITKILLELNNVQDLDTTILGAKIDSFEGNLGSGEGWHRDRSDEDQFKAILYLTDVGPENGPFQILYKSHRKLRREWLHYIHKISKNQTRFPKPEEIQKIESLKTKIFCAPKGTLIIANTRSVHRGMPIFQGSRYALTVYNWPKGQFPEHIKKMTLS